jgi:ATP adenylyltransferase/5',5'''-P-1,P-4-tetraphosphate phosphorylase II
VSSRNHHSQTAAPFRKSDVFLEPFEEGICIDDNLTKTHRLLFNKYPSRKHHVLVITKEKELQGDLLNTRDFEASIIAMKTLDGFLFYNSSVYSGAS